MADEWYEEEDEEDELYCSECDSELDCEDGTCVNELCEYYTKEPPHVEDDSWLRAQERKQMGFTS
jgi:hypothetical protein